jgi:hypothetical protein
MRAKVSVLALRRDDSSKVPLVLHCVGSAKHTSRVSAKVSLLFEIEGYGDSHHPLERLVPMAMRPDHEILVAVPVPPQWEPLGSAERRAMVSWSSYQPCGARLKSET